MEFDFKTKPYSGNMHTSARIRLADCGSHTFPEYINIRINEGTNYTIHQEDWLKIQRYLNERFPVVPEAIVAAVSMKVSSSRAKAPKTEKFYTQTSTSVGFYEVRERKMVETNEHVARFTNKIQAEEYAEFLNEKERNKIKND